MRTTLKGLTLTAAAIAAVAVGNVGAANAAPSQGGNYPHYAHEGQYRSSCAGTYSVVRSASTVYRGKTVTLHLYYNGNCGAYGELSGPTVGAGTAKYCSVTTFRNTNPGGWVKETVDPGDTFAYTKLVNDLQGRTAYARASCSSQAYPGGPNDGSGFALVTGSY